MISLKKRHDRCYQKSDRYSSSFQNCSWLTFCTAWWFDIIDPYWFHWEVQNSCCHYLISALKLLQTKSRYSSFSAVRIIMLQFHSVLYTDKSREPASFTWRVALAQIGEEYLTADRHLDRGRGKPNCTLDLSSCCVYIFDSNYCPTFCADRFLWDFFGIAEYLVVIY